MRVYLNDWSLSSNSGVFANWESIKAFEKLIGELSQKCALEIYAPANLWQLSLAGYNVVTSETVFLNDRNLSLDMVRFLKSIYKRMSGTIDGYPLFSEQEDMSNSSSCVGHAVSGNYPVLSLVLDGKYAQSNIEGWLQEEGLEPTKNSVVNIYESNPENYQYLVDLTLVAGKDPKVTPLWNVKVVGALLEKAGFVKTDNKMRQGLLRKYGRIVAEMNGWRYNSYISKLNQNSGQLRDIYSSDYFVGYPVAYLSLDMEGPDLGFELCDKKGNHLGEYSWDGGNKPPKEHHGIKVK